MYSEYLNKKNLNDLVNSNKIANDNSSKFNHTEEISSITGRKVSDIVLTNSPKISINEELSNEKFIGLNINQNNK